MSTIRARTPSSVLVVGDCVDRFGPLEQVLSERGYSVVTALTLQEAATAARDLPHLIVLDTSPRDFDVLGLCLTLKSDLLTSSIPILIACQEQSGPPTVKEILAAGADDCLENGIPPELARKRILRLLDQSTVSRAHERATRGLTDTLEHHRHLLECASDVIFTHDLDGNFTSFNRAAELLTGYTREEGLRLNIADVIAPEYLAEARNATGRQVSGETLAAREMEIISAGGLRIPIEVNSHLICRDGKPVGVQGI